MHNAINSAGTEEPAVLASLGHPTLYPEGWQPRGVRATGATMRAYQNPLTSRPRRRAPSWRTRSSCPGTIQQSQRRSGSLANPPAIGTAITPAAAATMAPIMSAR